MMAVKDYFIKLPYLYVIISDKLVYDLKAVVFKWREKYVYVSTTDMKVSDDDEVYKLTIKDAIYFLFKLDSTATLDFLYEYESHIVLPLLLIMLRERRRIVSLFMSRERRRKAYDEFFRMSKYA